MALFGKSQLVIKRKTLGLTKSECRERYIETGDRMWLSLQRHDKAGCSLKKAVDLGFISGEEASVIIFNNDSFSRRIPCGGVNITGSAHPLAVPGRRSFQTAFHIVHV